MPSKCETETNANIYSLVISVVALTSLIQFPFCRANLLLLCDATRSSWLSSAT